MSEVQRTSYPMLVGVVDEAEVRRLENLINDLRTEIEAIRADVVPIAVANLISNPQFFELKENLRLFAERYGILVKDMDLNVNPIFSALETRMDQAETQIIDALTRIQVLTDQQNGFHQRLRAIEQQLGIPTP